MPKVCPAQQGDTAACTPVKKHVSQLLTSHSVWNLEHNFCKYCRAYTTANIKTMNGEVVGSGKLDLKMAASGNVNIKHAHAA